TVTRCPAVAKRCPQAASNLPEIAVCAPALGLLLERRTTHAYRSEITDMITRRQFGLAAASLLGGVATNGFGAFLDPEQWNQTVEKAINYLKSTQADDGSWSKEKSPGVTGIVLAGMLQTGKLSPKDPAAERAL